MELFEKIRREYEFGEGTIAGVARKLGVHRRMVREAIGSALPIAAQEDGACSLETGGAIALWTDAGSRPEAHRVSSAHTGASDLGADQRGVPGVLGLRADDSAERSKAQVALGLVGHEICIPQSYDWGVEAQVDWYEAYADIGGERG